MSHLTRLNLKSPNCSPQKDPFFSVCFSYDPVPSPHQPLPKSGPDLPGHFFRDWLVISWVVNLNYIPCLVRVPFA